MTDAPGLHLLTLRERAVYDLAAQGVSNRAIAEQLRISLKTVETHRAKVNKKLGVHTPAQLVIFAHREAKP